MLELIYNGRLQRTYRLEKPCSCCGNVITEYPKMYEGCDSLYMNRCYVRMSENEAYDRSLKGRWENFKFEFKYFFSRGWYE